MMPGTKKREPLATREAVAKALGDALYVLSSEFGRHGDIASADRFNVIAAELRESEKRCIRCGWSPRDCSCLPEKPEPETTREGEIAHVITCGTCPICQGHRVVQLIGHGAQDCRFCKCEEPEPEKPEPEPIECATCGKPLTDDTRCSVSAESKRFYCIVRACWENSPDWADVMRRSKPEPIEEVD